MTSLRFSTKFLRVVPGVCAFLIPCTGAITTLLLVRHHASILTVLPLLLLQVALLAISILCVVTLLLKRGRGASHA